MPESTSQHPLRFAKQPGVTVGGAGFASNAFGFANFGCKQSTVKTKNNNDTIGTYKASNPPCDANKPTLGMTRNPPHAFGAGYTQKLAQEMTITLQDLLEKAKASLGKSVALKAKGISFGVAWLPQQMEKLILAKAILKVLATISWLHDGRALSLTEAIVLHKSDGSDASDSVGKFNALSKADKKTLITFLSTLHLPAYNP